MQLGGIIKAMFRNAISVIPKGKITVFFPQKKQTISFQFPKIYMAGALWGKRYIYFYDHMKFEDVDNNLKAVIAFAYATNELKKKRIHDIYGEIFKYEYKKDDLQKPFYSETIPYYPFPSNKNNVICKITGSWLEEIKFDDKVAFLIKESYPPPILPSDNVLPSDSRFREDKIWLKHSFDNKELKLGKIFEGYAQSWKLGLEAQQRYEKELRQKGKDKKEKK